MAIQNIRTRTRQKRTRQMELHKSIQQEIISDHHNSISTVRLARTKHGMDATMGDTTRVRREKP
jgi:hypothetical protein